MSSYVHLIPLKLRLIPDPILHTKCTEIASKDTSKAIEFAEDAMIPFMHRLKGLGLAAPQIGLTETMFVTADVDNPVFINPVIKMYGRDKWVSDEGCLSIPHKDGAMQIYPVVRSIYVWVDWIDWFGRRQYKRLSGKLSLIVQHEYDHLQGKTIDQHEQDSTNTTSISPM